MDQDPPEEIVCPNCGHLTRAHADFCAHCQGPVSPYTVLDPYKRIATGGFMLRQAAGQRVPLWGLILVWLVFVAIVAITLRWALLSPGLPPDIWKPALCWFVCGYVAYRATRSYITGRRMGRAPNTSNEE